MGLFDDNLAVRVDTVPRHIPRLTCDAKNCLYHDGDGFCTAERITIGSVTASTSTETKCATFRQRAKL